MEITVGLLVRELSEVVRLRARLSAGETEQLQAPSSSSLGLNDKDNSLKQCSSWLVRSSILSRLKYSWNSSRYDLSQLFKLSSFTTFMVVFSWVAVEEISSSE